MKTTIMKLKEVVNLEENTWGIDILNAVVVEVGKFQVDIWGSNKTGKDIGYRDLVIKDDTGESSLRVKTNRLFSNEYIALIKPESRIRLLNVGWLINQKRITTFQSKFAGSDIMIDEDIDKHDKK